VQEEAHVEFDLLRKHEAVFVPRKVKIPTYYYAAKRVIDFTFALILLVLLSPMMLLVAAVIYLYSPGPVFFVQERAGASRESRGKYSCWKRTNFKCYKFRTMKVNADPSIHKAYIQALIENDDEQMTALQTAPTRPRKFSVDQELLTALQTAPTRPRKLVNDSRIIPPGKILRKLSLDELPQLFNVLRGEMSLVGPRPAIPYEVEMYKPWHLRRLEALPGITGLQQVTARNTADFDEQVKLDIEYVKNQSLWLDIKIILKTPFAVISAKGAY
jgi:lipopolysaccharide/colanic/teichoic acid biosynthesis glycosyltransferase